MAVTILSVAFPFAPVGPAAVGGAEMILTALEADLVQRGFRSLVLACAGSQVAGTLIPVPLPPALTDQARAETAAAMQCQLDRLFAREHIDLIHMHGIDFYQYRIPPEIPVMVTLHLPPAWYPESIWHLPPQYRLMCVSEHQRRSCPDHAQARLQMLPNGVALPSASPRLRRHDFALMLSRICPEKNLHAGFDAARLAGVPCVLGGEVFPYEDHLRYLREEIEPRLGPAARWPGALTGERKRRFLQAARCVLLPTVAPETSSLAAIEALAAGTPVIAFRSGALPEIITDGETGFLVDSVEAMAEAIGRTGEIDPAHCRAVAARRFGFAPMAERYRTAYADALSRQETHA